MKIFRSGILLRYAQFSPPPIYRASGLLFIARGYSVSGKNLAHDRAVET